MKQIAQNYKTGELTVLDVPVPACRPGGVLVRSLFSLISTGTEMMKVTEAKLSMVGKARARPDQVRKVLDTVAQQGAVATYKKVTNRLDSYTPLGYSLCGVVDEVGRGSEDFQVGQLVAAAGNEYALHAEYNWVPVNMCVPVPPGVSPGHAAFSTVGAVAMRGVRQGEVQLGEIACVIGLGLVGQLVVRLLVAAGVRVVGLDMIEDRCKRAEQAGAAFCAAPTGEGMAAVQQALAELTGGRGADHVFLAAGGASNGPVETAVKLARDRARVVDIGKTRLDLPWNAYYEKELDVRFSRSYGPGRYDDRYELEGIDYPASYVRWTARRNIECFLDLLAHKEIEVETLVTGVFPIKQATTVYADLASGAAPAVGVLLSYPAPPGKSPARSISLVVPTEQKAAPRSTSTGQLAAGFIGAGNYASSMLLPHLARMTNVHLAHVATSTVAVGGQCPAPFRLHHRVDRRRHRAGRRVARRDLHRDAPSHPRRPGLPRTRDREGRLRREAARSHQGRARPDRRRGRKTGNDRLMVGFNRRFAPLLVQMKSRFGQPVGSSVTRYLVSAGPLEADSRYHNEELDGSRFIGEGGHFIDTLSWWTGSLPEEVYAARGADHDDVQATVRFRNGSIGTITYVTVGNPRYPKETLDAAADGRSARLDNFLKVTVWTGRHRNTMRSRGGRDKGQRRELELFAEAVRTGAPMPIAFESLVTTTSATMAVTDSLASGRREPV